MCDCPPGGLPVRWLLALVIQAAVLLGGAHVAAAESPLWEAFARGARPLVLPDFSYAGYRHGEQPIPTVAGPVFRVTDYGAIADDGKSDAKAIQKAVAACEAAGGGVVLFPRGMFIINDDHETATAPRVRIRKGRVILRGAGAEEGGTVLYSPREMQPENPAKMWSGRVPIEVRPDQSLFGRRTARVVAAAPLNAMALTLEASHPFKVGDRVCLNLKRSGNAGASFVAPHRWDRQWTAGIEIRELHEIVAVKGATVRFSEPLMMPVDGGDDWTLQEARFISRVGVEDLRFRGAWKESFRHHRSWRDDSAWRGMRWSGVENGWIRRCVFEDMNMPLEVTDSRQVTVEDVTFTGTRGHFGVGVIGTYGVLNLAVRDRAGHYHGPSVQGGSCATVYHGCTWADDGSFDSHANNPYATLHDCNAGGLNLAAVGGARENRPHHLHALVLWNLSVTRAPPAPVDFWTAPKVCGKPRAFTQVIIAGLSGEPVQFAAGTVWKNESQGVPVTPRSLFLAQLERRLRRLPDHFRRYAVPVTGIGRRS